MDKFQRQNFVLVGKIAYVFVATKPITKRFNSLILASATAMFNSKVDLLKIHHHFTSDTVRV